MDKAKNKSEWKQKIIQEFINYWITVTYLFLYFGVFLVYKRLVLDNFEISYMHYGFAAIKALILAKVILIGDALRIGHRLEHKPLALSTLYQAIMFTVWVGVFSLIEKTVMGLLHGEGMSGGFREIIGKGKNDLLASSMIVFFTFIPFFAFKELSRVMGEGKIWNLFFLRRVATE